MKQTGGEFEPGDIGQFLGQSIKSDNPLAENLSGAARLTKAINAAAQAPLAQAPRSQPPISKTISGKTYQIENNPINLKSFSLTFSRPNEAVVRLEFTDGRIEQRPVGLDGVPRISAARRFGLAVALQGAWETEHTFQLEYNEVANINSYAFSMTFSGDNDVTVEVKERTGLSNLTFHGHRQ